MKIDKIDLYPVSVPYKVIEKSSRVYRSGVSDIIIKITTDDGIVGWGEATRTASAKVIIESLEAMKPVLMNQDPWQNLKHEKNIYDEALWHWSAVTANLAYAGIDMALWDIYGKQVNKPIYQLLGGSLRDEVSYFYYLTWTDINDLIKQCQDGINKGYDVFYLKIGKDEILVEKMVKVVRSDQGQLALLLFTAYVGAVIYFFQQDLTVWGFIVALLKAIFWPAYVVFEALSGFGV